MQKQLEVDSVPQIKKYLAGLSWLELMKIRQLNKGATKEEQLYLLACVSYQGENKEKMGMECLNYYTAFKYVLGKLRKGEKQRYDEHVQGCDICEKYMTLVEKTPKHILEHLVSLHDEIDVEQKKFLGLSAEEKISVDEQFDYLFGNAIKRKQSDQDSVKKIRNISEALIKKTKARHKR